MTRPVTLANLADARFWVAWQLEARKAGDKPTKVPYSPSGHRASANKPASWGTRAAAETQLARLPRPYGSGGIGLEFAPLADGRCTGGIDFDTCRDPSSGLLLPWARSLVDSLSSYTEVSPSETGVKTFFTFDAASYSILREALGRSPTGGLLFSKNWKLPGDNHPPGIELHFGHRYFATTFDALPGTTEELRLISTVDLLRLINVDLPHFSATHGGLAGQGPAKAASAQPGINSQANVSRGTRNAKSNVDKSRSAVAFAIAKEARRSWTDFKAMCDAIKTHPATADWFTEKGIVDHGRELRRVWENTDLATGTLILSRGKPLESARQFVLRQHKVDQVPTLLHQNATFYKWQHSHYREFSSEEMRSQLYAFLEDAKIMTDEGEVMEFDPTISRVTNIADALAAVVQVSRQIRPPAWLVDNKGHDASEIVCCANKLLHLPTGDTVPHTPSFFTLNALPFDYQPNAPAPAQWLTFLKSLWPDDQDSINTLQELFGLCLTAETRHQKAFLLVGPKRSGKGTIARILTQLIGPDNVAAPTLSGLATQFGLAPLIGKRIAIISDARLSGKADQQVIVERVLSITGEDGLTIDRKYLGCWTGKLDTRFVILTNEMPRLTDNSGALASRFVIIRMEQSFYGKEDLGLGSKLQSELPGILTWAIEGWKRLTKRGLFVPPASSEDAQRELEDLGSPVGAFLRGHCTVGQGHSVGSDELYRQWCDWCQDQGRDHPGTKQTFGRDLAAAIPGLKTTQPRDESGDRKKRYYEGVGLSVDGLTRGDTRARAL